MFDTHIHLDLYEAEERNRMLEAAWGSGIEGVVSVSMGLESCLVNREFALRHDGRIMPAYGHHPEQPPLDEEGLQVLCDWIQERGKEQESFAIGEVGLPYYTRKEAEEKGEVFDLSPYRRQLEGFIRLASELNRPIALHAVYEDADTVLDLLERHSIRKAHFHWFKGSSHTVTRIVRNGYYISVTPDVLYEQEIRELVAAFPIDRLMVETDGPWPFEGPFAGKHTEPGMVRDVIREISLLRGLDVRNVTKAVNDNSRNFYGWNFDQRTRGL
ncbi:TatD family hydrolase [Cohnella silvisoli]|uniref:TatD family hydrolase n=1 Tax=Cohnella silvisoli TaxID=2873699 RepID=A0ABV1KUT8_9BACL|nr:TatD family hydrolase [Cohnella silvisoli]